jgi:hypothetical protein
VEHFEYVMVIVSIILGLGLTQILRGLSKLVRGARPSGVVLSWALLLFLMHLQVWWALWDLKQVQQWTQVSFTLVCLIPCTLFGMTELLLPMASTPESQWEEHFLSVRRWFFRLFVVFVALAVFETWFIMGVPIAHPYRLVQFTELGLGVIGLSTANLRVHRWIVFGGITVLIVGQALFRLLPGLQ